MDRLIIDLRDNPGGVLTEACNIADMLLPEGTITYTENKQGERKYYNSDAESLDIPIVILINGNSASASEVLTGALKDYGKAYVVGTTSYGKGIVQDVYPFYDGSGISLTSAKYYTPNGVCIHEIGIEPDETVELPDEYKNEYASLLPRSSDAQLQRAIEIIKEK
jgi:carboxyl-terminal processing protease